MWSSLWKGTVSIPDESMERDSLEYGKGQSRFPMERDRLDSRREANLRHSRVPFLYDCGGSEKACLARPPGLDHLDTILVQPSLPRSPEPSENKGESRVYSVDPVIWMVRWRSGPIGGRRSDKSTGPTRASAAPEGETTMPNPTVSKDVLDYPLSGFITLI